MPRIRFTISGLMGLIVVAAIGFAGIREGTEIWASLTFTVTLLVGLMAFPCLFYTQGKTRAGWAGFVLFSWAYLYFTFGLVGRQPRPSAAAYEMATDLCARPDPRQGPIHTQPQLPRRPDDLWYTRDSWALDHQTGNHLLDGRRAPLSAGRAVPAGPCARRLWRFLVSVRIFLTVQSADATGPLAAVTN